MFFAWLMHKLFKREYAYVEYGNSFYITRVHRDSQGKPFVFIFDRIDRLSDTDNFDVYRRYIWLYKNTDRVQIWVKAEKRR